MGDFFGQLVGDFIRSIGQEYVRKQAGLHVEKSDAVATADGRGYIMQVPRSERVLKYVMAGLLVAMGMFVPGLLCFSITNGEELIWCLVGVVFFGSICLAFVILTARTYQTQVWLFEEGIELHGPFRQSLPLAWTEIEAIFYEPAHLAFGVQGRGQLIRIPQNFIGLRLFRDIVERMAPALLKDQEVREKLP